MEPFNNFIYPLCPYRNRKNPLWKKSMREREESKEPGKEARGSLQPYSKDRFGLQKPGSGSSRVFLKVFKV